MGPQSADSISKYSQLSRFENFLQKTEGKKVTFEQEKELSSIVFFLDRNYTFEVLIPYAPKKLGELYKKDKDPGPSQIVRSLGFEYRSEYEQKEKENDSFNYYFYENDNNAVVNIHGYDFTFILNQNNSFECSKCITLDNITYSIKSKTTDYGQELKINEDIIPLKINEFINTNSNFRNGYNSDTKIEQIIENSKYIILINYLSANGKIENNKKIPRNYQIKIMAAIKK